MMWPRAKLKFVARFGYGDALPNDEPHDGAFRVYGSNGHFASFSRSNTGAPAIIIGRKGSYGKVNWTEEPCFASDTTFFVDESTSRNHLRWIYWLLQTLRLDEGTDEAAVPGLNRETAYSRDVLVPPFSQQRIIADYLDHETARLDALVVAKERALGLLAEKRRALITGAVTHGLDPRTPLRDSGIPRLGKIPAHWKLTRLKFVACVQTGIALGKSFGNKLVREYPYLRVGNVQDGYLDLTEVKSIAVPDEEALVYHLQTGDVLMNEGGDADKLGRGTIWTGRITPCLHQNHVFAVRPQQILPDWLNCWISSDVAKAYFESRAKQSTNLASISASNLREMPLLKPPDHEQRGIVDHITRYTANINKIRETTIHTITRLKERRAALIAAAVTGQIDVESAA